MGEEFRKIRVSPKEPEKTYPFTLYCTESSYMNRRADLDSWIRELADSAGMVGGFVIGIDNASYSEATLDRSKLFETHHGDN